MSSLSGMPKLGCSFSESMMKSRLMLTFRLSASLVIGVQSSGLLEARCRYSFMRVAESGQSSMSNPIGVFWYRNSQGAPKVTPIIFPIHAPCTLSRWVPQSSPRMSGPATPAGAVFRLSDCCGRAIADVQKKTTVKHKESIFVMEMVSYREFYPANAGSTCICRRGCEHYSPNEVRTAAFWTEAQPIRRFRRMVGKPEVIARWRPPGLLPRCPSLGAIDGYGHPVCKII